MQDRIVRGQIGNLSALKSTLKKTSLVDALNSLDQLMNGDASVNGVIPAKAEKRAFDLRSTAEWDATVNATFSQGQFATSTPGTANGKAARALASTGTQNLVIQARMYWDGTQNACYIGYNTAASGSLDTGSNTWNLIGFSSAGGGFVLNYQGTITVIVATASLTTGWYQATLFLFYGGALIVSLQKDGSTTATSTIAAGAYPAANNIQIQCYAASDKIQDVRYAALVDSATARLMIPQQSYNARNFHTPIRMNVSGVSTVCHIPASYDPTVKNRWVIFNHGSGGQAADLWNWPNENSLLQGLLDAGYVVVASDYTTAKCWGNAQSQTDIQNLINQYKGYLNLGNRPYMIGESMGGMVTMNAIAKGIVNPRAVVGIFPALNLAQMHTTSLGPDIDAAYGTPFATTTVGFDALNSNPGTTFAYIPMMFWASYSDTTVDRTQNSDAFQTKVNNAGGNIIVNTSTGNHGDASNFNPTAVVNFFNQY